MESVHRPSPVISNIVPKRITIESRLTPRYGLTGYDDIWETTFPETVDIRGETIRTTRYIVGALAMLLLSVSAMQASAEYVLQEDVIYAEGTDWHGMSVVVQDEVSPKTLVGAAGNVVADWSDNIVYHQFAAGSKIRTEVVLHQVDADGDLGPAVYTLTAHLKINELNEDGTLGEEFYSSSVAQGVFTDGPNDYYSAEVNELGDLLYGYNWDTRAMGCDAGSYRLTFWLEKDDTCPDVNPLSGEDMTYNEVNLALGAEGDTVPLSGEIYGEVGYDFVSNTTWIDIVLLENSNGRCASGSAHWSR